MNQVVGDGKEARIPKDIEDNLHEGITMVLLGGSSKRELTIRGISLITLTIQNLLALSYPSFKWNLESCRFLDRGVTGVWDTRFFDKMITLESP